MVKYPQVSVIVPMYNNEKTIMRTINSVLQQSYKNIELLVVDNGSSDKSISLVTEVQDERLSLLFSENGRGNARNLGINHASGKYLQFLDSDDELVQGSIFASVNEMLKNPELCAVVTNADYFKNSKKISSFDMLPIFEFSKLLKNNLFPIQSVFFKNESIINFDESLDYAEDWWFWIENLRNKVLMLPETIGSNVYITGENSSRNTLNLAIGVLIVRGRISIKYGYVESWKSIIMGLLKFQYGDSVTKDKFENEVKRAFPKLYWITSFFSKSRIVRQLINKRIKSASSVYD